MNYHTNDDNVSHQNQLQSIMKRNKEMIMSTANDAIQSKLSAVNKGYYKDPFVPYFAAVDGRTSTSNTVHTTAAATPKTSHSLDDDIEFNHLGNENLIMKERMRRRMYHSMMTSTNNHHYGEKGRTNQSDNHHQPLIRRGTFARTCVIDYAISSFLSLCYEQIIGNDEEEDEEEEIEDIQIVILGSGRDTSFLRAKCGLIHSTDDAKIALEDGIMDNVKWYEIDYDKVIQEKKELLASCPLLDFEFEHLHHSNIEKESNNEDEERTSFAISPNQIYMKVPRTKNSKKYQPTLKGLASLQDEQSSKQYHLVGFDLCDPFSDLIAILQKYHSFKLNVPTLFVMECFQMYIPGKDMI
jgi:hypothetical protein